jgi:hypothetical protein
MKRLLSFLLAVALLGGVSVTCFALGKITEREDRMSMTLSCVDSNGAPAISVATTDGIEFVSNNLRLIGGDQSVTIKVHDKEVEVTIGGQVIQASELRLITNLHDIEVEGKIKK